MKTANVFAGFVVGATAFALITMFLRTRGRALSPAELTRAHLPRQLRGKLIQMPARA